MVDEWRFRFNPAGVWLALGLLLVLALQAFGQVSDPEVVNIPKADYHQENYEFVTGTPVDSIAPAVSLDTMQAISSRLIVTDVTDSTVTLSTNCKVGVTSRKDGFTVDRNYTGFYFPPGSSSQSQPDSLFIVYLDSASVAEDDEFNITAASISEDAARTAEIVFDSDTIFGTQVDTSDAIDVSNGVTTATFGYANWSQTGVVYEVLYNLGKRLAYGPAVPSDTLADSTGTRDTAAKLWRFWDTDLAEAQTIKIIRRGKAAADTTGPVSELLRWRR